RERPQERQVQLKACGAHQIVWSQIAVSPWSGRGKRGWIEPAVDTFVWQVWILEDLVWPLCPLCPCCRALQCVVNARGDVEKSTGPNLQNRRNLPVAGNHSQRPVRKFWSLGYNRQVENLS